MLHRDCGAYGGSKSFADLDTETKDQTDHLAAARQFLANEIAGVPIETCFAEFDGLYKI
jgi:hypothetical protein